MNNSTKEATTDYFASANNPLLLSLFSGIHWSPELWQTIVKSPDSEEHWSTYLRRRFGHERESLLGWMVRTLPDQDPFMNCKRSVTMSSSKLSLALLQQIRCAWRASSLWPEYLSIPADNFSSGEDEGVQCKQSIPVNSSSYRFLKQRWLQVFPSSTLPAQTCPYHPFHGVSTAACGALQEARSWFLVGVIFNMAPFIRLVCHLAPQTMPGVIIWNKWQGIRGPGCTLSCCYQWKQHMKKNVAWRISFNVVASPGFGHWVWD